MTEEEKETLNQPWHLAPAGALIVTSCDTFSDSVIIVGKLGLRLSPYNNFYKLVGYFSSISFETPTSGGWKTAINP